MKKKQFNPLRLFFFLFIFFITGGLSHAEMKVSEIIKRYSQSVVTIITLDKNNQPLSIGSGFFVSENGNIATNAHVLEGCAKAIIKTKSGKKASILQILNYDPQLDLVIAKTSLKLSKSLPIADSDSITVGDDILAIGNPAGLEGTVSKGIISGIREIDKKKYIQITAPISPGSSGGPVFNLNGKVIGVATAYLTYGQNLNFALPVNYLKSLKPNKLKLSSFPKIPTNKTLSKDESLVQVFDIFYNYSSNDNLNLLEFTIKNLNNYPIKNIELFFVYKNYKGEIISYSSMKLEKSILPKLALQFINNHYVRHFRHWDNYGNKKIEGEVEIRILDYEIDQTSEQQSSDVSFDEMIGIEIN